MKFTKMHGCGNDYVYIDCFREQVPADEEQLKTMIRTLSDRHFGIGGDGVILIRKGTLAPFEMCMYNADGSYSPMCGNGIRCVAKYIYDEGLCREKEFDIESGGSVKHMTLTVDPDTGKAESITVDMGKAILTPSLIPVRLPDDKKAPLVLMEPITVGDREYKMTCVSMGNPHAVVFLDEMITDEEILKYGPLFEHHSYFPERINTEFVRVLDEHTVSMRVWERGTGETLACGTGTCAVTVASILNGFCKSPVTVRVLGGEVTDTYDEESGKVFMTGPAETVFTGETDLY